MPNDNKQSPDIMPTNHLAFCPHTINSRLVDFKKLLNFQNSMKKSFSRCKLLVAVPVPERLRAGVAPTPNVRRRRQSFRQPAADKASAPWLVSAPSKHCWWQGLRRWWDVNDKFVEKLRGFGQSGPELWETLTCEKLTKRSRGCDKTK